MPFKTYSGRLKEGKSYSDYSATLLLVMRNKAVLRLGLNNIYHCPVEVQRNYRKIIL